MSLMIGSFIHLKLMKECLYSTINLGSQESSYVPILWQGVPNYGGGRSNYYFSYTIEWDFKNLT